MPRSLRGFKSINRFSEGYFISVADASSCSLLRGWSHSNRSADEQSNMFSLCNRRYMISDGRTENNNKNPSQIDQRTCVVSCLTGKSRCKWPREKRRGGNEIVCCYLEQRNADVHVLAITYVCVHVYTMHTSYIINRVMRKCKNASNAKKAIFDFTFFSPFR